MPFVVTVLLLLFSFPSTLYFSKYSNFSLAATTANVSTKPSQHKPPLGTYKTEATARQFPNYLLINCTRSASLCPSNFLSKTCTHTTHVCVPLTFSSFVKLRVQFQCSTWGELSVGICSTEKASGWFNWESVFDLVPV